MPAKKEKYEEKKIHIIKTAASVFSQNGFYGTVLSDIARLAGIGKGTIYEYFSSKEELFFTVFEWINREMKESARVEASALGKSAAGRLRIMNEIFVNAYKEMQELYTLTLEFWSAAASSSMRERFQQALRQIYVEYRQIVAGIIHDGVKSGEFVADTDAEATAAALVGAWDGMGLQAWLEKDFAFKDTSRQFLEVIIRGLHG